LGNIALAMHDYFRQKLPSCGAQTNSKDVKPAWAIAAAVRSRTTAVQLENPHVSSELNEQRYRAILEDQVETICRFRIDGTVLYVNDAFCKLFGRARDELEGKSWHPVALEQDIAHINAELAKLSPQNPVVTIENRVVNSRQEIRWCQFVNRGFFDDKGALIEIQSVGRDITDRKTLQEKLDQVSAENADLFNNAPCGYHSLGPDGTYSRINDTELNWLGRKREELIGKLTPLDVYTDASRRKFEEVYAQFRSTGRLHNEIFEMVSTNGERRMVSVDASAIKDTHGAIIASRTVLYDVTDLERVRAELRQMTVEQQTLLDSGLIGIMKLHEREITWVNSATRLAFGYEADEFIGRNTRFLYPDEASYRAFGERAYPTIQSSSKFRTQVELVRKDGRRIWVDTSGAHFNSEPQDTVWMFLDITESKTNEASLERLASTDVLTGFLRKRMLRDELGQAMARTRRRGGLLAVLYVDLDAFKQVNDKFGHHVGDEVLREVGKRMLEDVRETDRVARAGGDEFVVVLEDVDDISAIARIAEKILQSLAKPIALIKGGAVCVGASIGVGLFPDDAQEIDRLVQFADQAMYKSKTKGGNCYTLFRDCAKENNATPWIDVGAVHRVGIEEVDRQHATLVRLANQLNEAVKAGESTPVIERLFGELEQYLRHHFATEEQMMEKHGYPDFDNHERLHSDVLDEVTRIKELISDGAEVVALQTIKDWLIDHVLTADRPMGEYLSQSGKLH
jgi:diguanylate cyclase (GGDEF)-like protein/hemerythrin-like metal-binding protein/PAS domain S-box-containing protein